jgi:hypothetical protein
MSTSVDPFLHTAVSFNCPVLAVNPVVVVGTELMVIVSVFAVSLAFLLVQAPIMKRGASNAAKSRMIVFFIYLISYNRFTI